MSDLLLMYWPAILAATVTGAALACLGAFLVTRQVAVQTLAVGQGASLGLLIGLVVVSFGIVHDEHLEHTIWPLFLGVAGGALTSFCSTWAARRAASKAGVFVASFALLWALSQLLTGFFPTVASHASSLYFGDIVTLGQGEALLFITLSSLALVYFGTHWRKLSDRAFLLALQDEAPPPHGRAEWLFFLVSIALLCLSIELLGLLFTLASLFLPTMVLVRGGAPGVGRHLALTTLCGGLAALGGFVLSLAEPRLLTSPSIAVLLFLVPLALSAVRGALFAGLGKRRALG